MVKSCNSSIFICKPIIVLPLASYMAWKYDSTSFCDAALFFRRVRHSSIRASSPPPANSHCMISLIVSLMAMFLKVKNLLPVLSVAFERHVYP